MDQHSKMGLHEFDEPDYSPSKKPQSADQNNHTIELDAIEHATDNEARTHTEARTMMDQHSKMGLDEFDEPDHSPSKKPKSADQINSTIELDAVEHSTDNDTRTHTEARTKYANFSNNITSLSTSQMVHRINSTSRPVDEKLASLQKSINNIPFKIYVYDLPPALNADLLECVDREFPDGCFDTSNQGFGSSFMDEDDEERPFYQGLSVHNTWQFSLEVILHHKLLSSPLRVLDPAKADVFYVPYYGAASCFCYLKDANATEEARENIDALVQFLKQQEPFQKGLPHVMALGKIEREMGSGRCILLQNPHLRSFTFIGIEQEVIDKHRQYIHNVVSAPKPLIAVPYPSYGHLNTNGTYYEDALHQENRSVLVFLAAATRRSNPVRSKVLQQMTNLTTLSFEEYFKARGPKNGSVDQVWLATPECRGSHNRNTIEWMRHSVFCLEPPGDSPTRKSFYDAVISGCIPVILSGSKYRVKYPFDDVIDYTKFTVAIPEQGIRTEEVNIVEFLKTLSATIIKDKRRYLRTVLKYLQYSYPISTGSHNDALSLILGSLDSMLKRHTNKENQIKVVHTIW